MKLVHASSHPLGTAEGTHIRLRSLYYDEPQSVTRKQPGLCFLGGMGERYIWHPNLGCVRKTCVLRDYGIIIVATDLDYLWCTEYVRRRSVKGKRPASGQGCQTKHSTLKLLVVWRQVKVNFEEIAVCEGLEVSEVPSPDLFGWYCYYTPTTAARSHTDT